MSPQGWRSLAWWRTAAVVASWVVVAVVVFEALRWLDDERPNLFFALQLGWFAFLLLLALRRRLREEPRFEDTASQERALGRALKQLYIPIGTDLVKLRAGLERRLAQQDSAQVAGGAVGLFAAVLYFAWPDPVTSEALRLPLTGAAGAAAATTLLLIPFSRGRRHAERLLESGVLSTRRPFHTTGRAMTAHNP